ncbi:MAG: hypothetical protein WAW61_00705 [Methylococcaceae bacterium]
MIEINIFKKIVAGILLFWQGCHSGLTAEFPVRELELPTAGVNQQHHLAHTANGKLILSWVESQSLKNIVRFAVYGKEGWMPPQTVISIDSKLADPPVVQGLSDGTLAGVDAFGKKR